MKRRKAAEGRSSRADETQLPERSETETTRSAAEASGGGSR